MKAITAEPRFMRNPTIGMAVIVVAAATIIALGYAAIHGIPYSHTTNPSCADHELALLAWGVLGGLVITCLGTVILAWFKSPIGGYVLLVGGLTAVAGVGFTLSIETHEFCGRESWWMEGALLAAFTLMGSFGGLCAGVLGWQLAAD